MKEILIISSRFEILDLICKFIVLIIQDIAGEKEKAAEEPKPLRFLVKVEKPVPRPPTPGVDVPNLVCLLYFLIKKKPLFNQIGG